MDDGETVQGGLHSVRRVGSTVVRPIGDHSPSVHRLLRHLESHGFMHAPVPIELDGAAGTETLTFVPGEVGHEPLPAEFRTDQTLIAAARLLRDLHDATADFVVSDIDTWFLPSREPVEVICHGDFAPYNCALDDRVLRVFDFDTAHPGPRSADLGYAAYRWVPLTGTSNAIELDEQRRRFQLFCAAYGEHDHHAVLEAAVGRLSELIDLMRHLAGTGHEAFARHVDDGHDVLYLADIEHIRSNAAELAR